jgi:hypothetical protein
MLFREIVAIYCDNHTKQIQSVEKIELFYVKAGGT